ncbi:hypothetical protein [Bdellovibrio sp. BCCA]|uniref:hypothetical protein n=1 Tax=Bdellovibrio sp. BCCA TaxID=3136281 RepID=UPI0030F05950
MINVDSRSQKLESVTIGKYPFYFLFDKNSPNGSSGHYFKHPYNRKIGVKVFADTKLTKEQDARNLYLRAQGAHEDIVWEAALINCFYKKRVAVVRFCIDTSTQDKYLGIVMPHFSGKHPQNMLGTFYCSRKDKCYLRSGRGRVPLATAINMRAFEIGFHLSDLHEQNVIVDSNGRPWPIDFGSHSIQAFKNFGGLAKEYSWAMENFKKHYHQTVKGKVY